MKTLFYSFVLISVLFTVAIVPETKAEFPDKTAEFITHSAPGGGTDVFIRTVAHILNNEGFVKPKIQVVNRQGGAAAVAINYVVSKKGDPYVVQQWSTAGLVAILRGTTTVKNPLDMTFISNLTEVANIIVVRTDSKYKNIKELIEDAKKNPKKINVGIQSQGGSEHIIASRIQKATGAQFTITSFPVSTVALLGGHIDFCFGTLGETSEHIKAQKFRALASVGEKRTSLLPDIPTLKEQGVDASFIQVMGFWGPPEMPDYAIKFWEKAFANLMETKAFKDYMKSVEMDPAYMGAEECRKFLVDYCKQFDQDLRELGAYGSKAK
jgi:putative tricarboxylic transport membrane protein